MRFQANLILIFIQIAEDNLNSNGSLSIFSFLSSSGNTFIWFGTVEYSMLTTDFFLACHKISVVISLYFFLQRTYSLHGREVWQFTLKITLAGKINGSGKTLFSYISNLTNIASRGLNLIINTQYKSSLMSKRTENCKQNYIQYSFVILCINTVKVGSHQRLALNELTTWKLMVRLFFNY